jgi:hypothetical protein
MMPAGAIDPDTARFDAVRRYLTEHFPEADIPAPTDFGGAAAGRVFSIEDWDSSTHQLELGRSIYADRSVAQLVTLLDRYEVGATMQANPDMRLVVAATLGGNVQCHVDELRR